jgi:hypothetical protein
MTNEQITQSKAKVITQEVNSQLAKDSVMLEEIIRNEILHIHSSGDADEWNQEYELIAQEVNQYLVRSLLDQSKWDEELNYLLNENFEAMAIEMQVSVNDPQGGGHHLAVCPICKMGCVHKFFPQKNDPSKVRLACENPGCLELTLDLRNRSDTSENSLKLERLMNLLNCLVSDHREHSQDRQNMPRAADCPMTPCEDRRDLQVEISVIQEA